jgi:heme/copper-type cytochrome/quinol oxidase subunit 1
MILTGAAFESDPSAPWPQRGLARVYLSAVAIASVLAVLFALATHLHRLSPPQPLMGADVFAQLALLRDALFALALALPTVTAFAHLALPPAVLDSPAERLERLALGAHGLGATALLAATLTTGWTCLLLVGAAGALVGIGSVQQAIAILGRLRTPGPPGLPRTMLARTLGVTALAELLVLPVVVALFALLVTERLTHTSLWRDAWTSPLLFEHWLRSLLQPLAYLAVVPCIGAVADVLGCRSRALVGAAAALLLLGAVGAAAHFGEGAAAVAIGSCFTLLLLAPLTVIVGNLVAEARLDGSAAVWFALGFVVALVELAATALPLALADVGQTLTTGAFAAAHHELLVIALAFALAAALHRAWPRLAHGSYRESLARSGAAVAFIGLQLTVAAQLVAGQKGMPVTFEYAIQFRALAITATVGWLLAAAGAILVGFNLVTALRRR